MCAANICVFLSLNGVEARGGLARKGFLFMEKGESMVSVQRTLACSFF